MKKKTITVAALASCIALSASLTGCSLMSTNSRADMAQTIATVNIKDAVAEKELAPFKSAISDTAIKKRNLVSYFLNVGYSYVQNGTSYADTFNMLVDALVNNAVLVQYSTLRLLYEMADGNNDAVLSAYNAADKSKTEKYEYLLGGADSDDVLIAKYNLYSSLNSAIDNYENSIIEEESESASTATRTTPVNLETEQDDYYPVKDGGGLDYNIYTGYGSYLLAGSGQYREDVIEGSTRATRTKAYNRFINNLVTNNLIDATAEEEYIKNDIMKLNYIQDEYANQLESRIITKYYELYEEDLKQQLLDGDISYVQNVYEQLFEDQSNIYKDASSFETALSSMSSTSFLLYSPDTEDSEFGYNDVKMNGKFGFVYNILLPFSAKQSAQLAELNSIKSADEDEDWYYNERNRLLKGITTEDQRSAWFNGQTDYSFKPADSFGNYFGKQDGREYLFFEGNLTDSEEGGRYEKLQAYDGRYSYNGTVYQNEDDSYTLIGEKLDINGMLKEFEEYINFVLGVPSGETKVEVHNYQDTYYGDFNVKYKNSDDEIDYSKFLYAEGQVKFGTFNNGDLFNPETDQYKAMSAVNELQFAYTTDTSVLSQYIGYSVSAYDTSYIKEFEYAAKLAVSKGEGYFTVCAGDYGWHLIYVTYVFDKEEMYGTPDWSRISKEGTFENLFFEWIKSDSLSDVSTKRRNQIINDYNKENVTVVKYQNRYQDLLDLDN